jgi:hypothetical protein
MPQLVFFFFQWQGIHSTSQSEYIWDLNRASAVGGENAVAILLSLSMSDTRPVF